MRRVTTLAGMVVATAALMLFVGTSAQASQVASSKPYHNPQVAWVGDVHSIGATGTVLAKYRCWGGNENTHLWVSLKQGGGIKGKTAAELSQMEGTSAIARAWYDTNAVDPALVTINCNGKWHLHRYTVGREKGTLYSGSAFLQFCLFDSTSDPTGQDLSHGFAYKYVLVNVHKHQH